MSWFDFVALAGGEDASVVEDDAGEEQFGGGERLIGWDDEVEGGVGVGGERGFLFGAADDPIDLAADDFAVGVDEEDGGAGGLDRVGAGVLHGQFDDGAGAVVTGRVHFNGEIGAGKR